MPNLSTLAPNPQSQNLQFYAADRKKELLPFGTAWMELESIMLSEIRLAAKHKYHMISPINRT